MHLESPNSRDMVEVLKYLIFSSENTNESNI